MFSLPRELDELKLLKQWVGYRLTWDDKRGKTRKIPVNPKTGGNAKADAPTTWGTFDEAISWAVHDAQSKGVQVGQAGGIGFEFGEPSGIMGIDLDAVILEDGTLKLFAADIVATLNSYTEFSPSGRGLHILCKIDMPLSAIGSNRRNDAIGLEMYDTGRFFTITGQIYGEPKAVRNASESIKIIYDKYLLRESIKNLTTTPSRSSTKVFLNQVDTDFEILEKMLNSWHGGEPKTVKNASESIKIIYDKYLLREGIKNSTTTPSRLPTKVFLNRVDTDFEILEKMFNSRHGREIRELYEGNISAHNNDWSRADLSLCHHLAYWTGGDERLIDELFRQSKLMRPKWDERHGAQTYGAMTINKALQSSGSYTQYQSRSYQHNHCVELPEYASEIQTIEKPEKSALNITYIADYFDECLENDLMRFQRYRGRKTGFRNIDAKTSLFPGLYIIGGISSLGKTTFAHQLADQLGRAGDHVLFFALEQTRLEIISKGLARLTAQENLSTAVSAIEIREGKITAAVRRAIAEYKSFSKHEAIIEAGFNTSFKEIANTIEEYIAATGERPVIFLDYIQLLRPLNSRMSAKDAVDFNIRAFKQLQMKFDLVVILLSSLNRQNYLTPIDFEAFKESGSIEFTADVIWGLQLAVMNDELFDSDKKLMAKRDTVKAAKRATPRKIELVCLKNRFGIANASYFFDYNAKFDLFTPVDIPAGDTEADDYSSKSKSWVKII